MLESNMHLGLVNWDYFDILEKKKENSFHTCAYM